MDYQAIWKYVKDWLSYLLRLFTNLFKTKKKLQHENIILYLQLALFIHEVETGKRPKPKITPAFRQIMVLHAKRYSDWKSIIKVCQPATVIGWFNNKFSLYWFKKSKKGRPSISPKTIALIKRIHRDNPLFSPEKIHDQLVLLNVTDAPAPNTIAKYLPSTGKPPSEKQIQTWLTFLRNHAPDTWGMDFLTVPTLFFKVLYVLVIINHDTREIIHFAVTANPNAFWLVQQLRNATPYDHKPKYLIHDNDAVFTSSVFKNFLAGSGIKSKRTAIKAPWQNPYAERVIGTLRRELLDYMIPVNERHLEHLLGEYVHKYYNTHRAHQGIDGRTPIPSPEYPQTTMAETTLVAKPVLGGLYHTYEKVA